MIGECGKRGPRRERKVKDEKEEPLREKAMLPEYVRIVSTVELLELLLWEEGVDENVHLRQSR